MKYNPNHVGADAAWSGNLVLNPDLFQMLDEQQVRELWNVKTPTE